MIPDVHVENDKAAPYDDTSIRFFPGVSVYDLRLAGECRDVCEVYLYFRNNLSRHENGVFLVFLNGKTGTRQIDGLQIDHLPTEGIVKNHIGRRHQRMAAAPELLRPEAADMISDGNDDQGSYPLPVALPDDTAITRIDHLFALAKNQVDGNLGIDPLKRGGRIVPYLDAERYGAEVQEPAAEQYPALNALDQDIIAGVPGNSSAADFMADVGKLKTDAFGIDGDEARFNEKRLPGIGSDKVEVRIGL